jgi:hypothetical protein
MFELPTNPKDKWIPEDWERVYEQMSEHSAWYSGDADQLIQFYATRRSTPSPNGRFWGENIQSGDRRTVVHTPLAGDIATFSADMMFSEYPDITIPEAHEKTEDGKTKENKRAAEAEKRLWEIIDRGGVMNRLLEAGETSSAMGGVYLKPTWDQEVADFPILTIAQPDNAIPHFRHGFLSGVIFHKIIKQDGDEVIRLLENYTKGFIYTGLYIGDRRTIGRKVPLTYLTETENIEPIINTHIDDILCRYVANKRPHKRFRGTQIGMSDLQGTETLMDALDMTMTSWLRDIALGRARLHVGEGMLENQKGNAHFDAGKELYVELDIDPSMMGDGKALTATQFEIRTEEHYKTATELATKIIHMAGFAPQSFGFNLDGNISTESHEIRERKTLITKQKKERFFKDPLEDIFRIMLEIDNIHLQKQTPTEFRPNVAFADTLGHDIGAIAKTAQMLKTAQAASIKIRVQMVHPDWSDEEVEEEVKRIREDEGLNADSPLNIGGKTYEF